MQHRFYDPATGQFVSRDPLNALTRSAYGYVAGDPLSSVDPSGLCTVMPGPDNCVGNAVSGAVDKVDNAVRDFKNDHGICTTDKPNCVPLKDSTTGGQVVFNVSVVALAASLVVLAVAAAGCTGEGALEGDAGMARPPWEPVMSGGPTFTNVMTVALLLAAAAGAAVYAAKKFQDWLNTTGVKTVIPTDPTVPTTYHR